MSDILENPNSRLETLVRQIMKAEDPVTFDDLCSKLRLVLDEKKSLASKEITVCGTNKAAG